MTRQRLYLETMQQVYANTSKVMVDAKGSGNLLYLPLDKLMQAAGATVAAHGRRSASAAAARYRRSPAPARCRRKWSGHTRDGAATTARGSLGSRERGER